MILNAFVSSDSDKYNRVFYAATYRESQTVTIGTGYYANPVTQVTPTNVMTDFSVEENLNKFLVELAEADAAAVEETYTAKDQLPTPNKDGYLFLGWFDGETQVTAVRANCTLVAKWVDIATLKYTISYDVAEGILPEGATTEFGYNETVVLPVPAAP